MRESIKSKNEALALKAFDTLFNRPHYGCFSNFGLPVNWIAADILRIKDGILVEHLDAIQDEAPSKNPRANADVRRQFSKILRPLIATAIGGC